jgi:cytochrome c553
MASSSTIPTSCKGEGAAAAFLVLAIALLPGCSLPQQAGPFEQTGEIIALSGGDAGAEGACVTCHGLNGEGDGNLVPRLAGLDRGYFARAMEHYAEGQRRHPQMMWIAGRLDWPARQKVADYYAELPVPARDPAWRPDQNACRPATAALYQMGDPSRGLQACATCHGADGRGVGAGNPPLAGQPAPYLAAQLRHWRSGERYGDPLGAMTHVSRLLAEEEVAALAGYSSALQGATSYPEPPATCPQIRRPDPRSDA